NDLTVYLHGGGFVIGDLDTHDEPCRILCARANVHVLSIEYRLAPEHPFPAALDDTLTALNVAASIVPGARISVGGDSAGANLATVASRIRRDEGSAPFAQLLIYPATDFATARPSHKLFS